MKLLILLICLNFIIGCKYNGRKDYKVTCEDPYFKGLAYTAYTNDDGTYIEIKNSSYYYPPSVKCEIVFGVHMENENGHD